MLALSYFVCGLTQRVCGHHDHIYVANQLVRLFCANFDFATQTKASPASDFSSFWVNFARDRLIQGSGTSTDLPTYICPGLCGRVKRPML